MEWRFNNRNNPHIFRDTLRRILTSVAAAASAVPWMGHDFVLRDDVWVDRAYRPLMPKRLCEGLAGQPAELAAFAQMAQAMVVVMED